MNRLVMAVALVVALAGSAWAQDKQDHNVWLGEQLKKLQSIKPGMTRAEVREILATEGGIYMRTSRTYVGRECRYCKVNVTFRAVGETEQNSESSKDVIVSVSQPYLQFAVVD